jgi:hypothetical protein
MNSWYIWVPMLGIGLGLLVYNFLLPRWGETFTEQHAEGEIDEKTRRELKDFFRMRSRTRNGEYDPEKTTLFQSLISLSDVDPITDEIEVVYYPQADERMASRTELEVLSLKARNDDKIEWCESVAEQLQQEFEIWIDNERKAWDLMMMRFEHDMERISNHRSLLEVE